ncbi:helix-turn-helix domain-containing protein [Streptomyces sp. SBST2-5]|uniref:Helix-turn-helix domain-containing protein n=1 Tax=Streptomyces composti TaxID=2720025 RepID=A0ABX1AGZ7_9ACTN|nr:transcriptional regulator [Streptomyces composti]NJP52883.1 helix-turn-helix domain-containing protein [Streptomyces composti]
MTAEPRFDEVIHAPHRLRICAALAAASETEFSVLRELLGVSDPVLSKHLRTLQDAGYVALTKPTGRGGRVRTWVGLTGKGRHALQAHVAELRRLTDHLPAESSGPSTAPG